MKRRNISYEDSHKIIDNIRMKKCLICEGWFPCNDNYFYKNKSSKKDGFSPYCKECEKKKNLQQKKNNPNYKEQYLYKSKHRTIKEVINVRNSTRKRRESGKYSEWQKSNPDKLKEYANKRQHKNHKINIKEWINCKQYFNMCCAYCGLPIEEHYTTYRGITKLGDFHKEHVDHEGIGDLSNCVPSCKDCNSLKWKHDFNEWYNKDNHIYSEERYNRIIKWISEDYKLYIIKRQ